MRSDSLSLAQARRIALAAQGFGDRRPTGRIDARHIRRVLDRIGVLQIDSVNVLVRSHELPLFARLGPYPRALLVDLTERRRELFEYWGHMASFIPVELYPALQWRMQRYRDAYDRGELRLQRERPDFLKSVLDEVAARGPLAASELSDGGAKRGPWWGWSDGKAALEDLFDAGVLTSAGRGRNFERLYDLPERVIPPSVLAQPTPTVAEGQRTLLRRAAQAQGVATAKDLVDYFRMKMADAKPLLAELVEAGDLLPVKVEGWREPAYLDPAAPMPRWIRAQALLSPFDSLIWRRERTEDLFGMYLRIEIYTPPAKRIHGYYVLPFLLGEQFVARVDLKSDRQDGVLRVQAVYHEHSADPVAPAEIAAALADELEAMAGWLGLNGVEVVRRGDLAGPLAHEITSRA